MCESLTQQQRYNYFLFEIDLLPHLTPEERLLVHIEPLSDILYCRLWYPKEKYKHDFITLRKQLTEATIAGNYDEVVRLGKLL